MLRTSAILAALLLLVGCTDSKETKKASPLSMASASSSVSTPVSSAAQTPKVAPKPTPKSAPLPASQAMNAATSAPQLTHKPETSPAMLFQKCAACHGNHAEKSALNQSAVIGEWDSKRITNAIVGYQDGTYGGAMKTLMRNQVKDLSRNQIEALSEYIANLYVKTH